MATTTAHPKSSRPKRRGDRIPSGDRSRRHHGSAYQRRLHRRRHLMHRLAVVGLTAGVVALAWALAVRADRPSSVALDSDAPTFELASTDGGTVSLVDHRGHDVLLYFNEGVGCDACFYQQAAIEADQQRFDDAGLMVLPIVVNPAADVRREMDRFSIRTPFLIDDDRSVSRAYDTIGRGHHADLPGHSFVLVDAEGRMRWRVDEPSMFVEPTRLIEGATQALAA